MEIFSNWLLSVQNLYPGWIVNFYIILPIVLLEIFFPARKFSLKKNFERVFLGFLYLNITIIFIYPLISFIASIINQNILSSYPFHGIKFFEFNFNSNFWTDHIFFAYTLATVVFWLAWDFAQYWVHRLFHHKYFYYLHRHHHDVELDVFASFRHTPLELVANHLLIGIPTSIYFTVLFPEMPIKYHLYMITFVIFIQHSNIKFGWPLSYIFITPQMHRIHHSMLEGHWNHNFSQYFIFWDWIFKTLYIPRKDEYPETGVVIRFEKMFTHYILGVEKNK
jgi:sterol desaturase/sphingolipid hydroxylase (fatty acid hydroxylase superfamily)